MIYSEVNDISFVVYLFYLKDVSAEEPVISQPTISKRWLNWSEKKTRVGWLSQTNKHILANLI